MKLALLRLAMLVAGLLVGLVFVEITLRVAGFSYPSFWTLDAERGWAARPGIEGRYVKEGSANVHINREGFRDRDHEKKTPGTFRIAVLGDSFVVALQVDVESTVGRILEKELSTCDAFVGQGVEVLNFGGDGYGTAQERITYRAFVRKYEPDVVLLAFYLGNDVSDNYRALDYAANRPYYFFDGGELSLDQSFRSGIDLRLSNIQWAHFVSLTDRIRLLQLVKEARHFGRRYVDRHRRSSLDFESGAESHVFVPPQDDDWTEAWRVTEGILTALRDDVERDGARFWLVAIPTPEQVHPEAGLRGAFMEGLGVNTLSYPETRLRSWAEKEAVPFVGLSDSFREYAERERVFLHGFEDDIGFGHWNESGHLLAGRIIAQQLCDAYVDDLLFSDLSVSTQAGEVQRRPTRHSPPPEGGRKDPQPSDS